MNKTVIYIARLQSKTDAQPQQSQAIPRLMVRLLTCKVAVRLSLL